MIRFRRISTIIFLFIVINSLNAQEVEVKNVSFTQMDEIIVIKYDLIGKTNKKYTIDISLSDNYGTSFRITPRTVRGDVGKGITPGRGKKIIWEMTEDYPNGLEGEGFVFAVDATLQKSGGGKTLYYELGAGVIATGLGYTFYRKTSQAYDDYKKADFADDAVHLYNEAERYNKLSKISFGIGGGLFAFALINEFIVPLTTNNQHITVNPNFLNNSVSVAIKF